MTDSTADSAADSAADRPRCSRCGGRDHLAYQGRTASADLWKCGECGHEFQSPLPRDPDAGEWPSKRPGTASL